MIYDLPSITRWERDGKRFYECLGIRVGIPLSKAELSDETVVRIAELIVYGAAAAKELRTRRMYGLKPHIRVERQPDRADRAKDRTQ